jgi:hypothetical protein
VIKTSVHFWDCNCENNYIHSKFETYCKTCGALCEEQPDSRIDEIKKYKCDILYTLFDTKDQIIDLIFKLNYNKFEDL